MVGRALRCVPVFGEASAFYGTMICERALGLTSPPSLLAMICTFKLLPWSGR